MKAEGAQQRRWRQVLTNAFIGGYLLVQLAVPAHYYLSDRLYDERFAWRMFSSIRRSPCSVQVLELHGRERNHRSPERDLHERWLRLLREGRSEVAEAYGRLRCAQLRGRGISEPVVLVTLRCRLRDGRLHKPLEDRNLCEATR